MIMKQYITKPILGLVFGVGVLLSISPSTVAAATETCTFKRNLDLGVTGDDVLCLQKYLNNNGFVIAASGAGAPGKETGEYKTLTQAAVVKWQKANKISPASGYFGAQSQAMYKSVLSGGTIASTAVSGTALVDDLLKKLQDLQKEKGLATTTPAKTVSATTVTAVSGTDKAVRGLITDVLEEMEVAEEAIADSNDKDVVAEATDTIEKARANFYAGLRKFLAADFAKAESLLEKALDQAKDATDEAGGDSEKQEAEDRLDEVQDLMDEVEEDIDLADEDGKATSESEDLYNEAEDLIDEANTAMDDEDYDEVLDLREEAEDLLNDALDAIGKKGGDVEDDLDKARDDLDDARDAVDEAIDDREDVGDAEDLLDEAEDLLDDAEDALDDDDEAEAEDLIDEAIDLIDEALDEF
jgi:Putative peptidoglycan binding domain